MLDNLKGTLIPSIMEGKLPKGNNMERLSSIKYFPAVRAGQYDLLALLEIENERKKKIAPIISIRGNTLKQVTDFATKWGDTPFWIDSSRFGQDTADPTAQPANDSTNNFNNKLKLFTDLKAINPKTLPVLGFKAEDSQRSVVQFGLQLLKEFPLVALRVEGSGPVLENNVATARAFLNAIGDEDFSRLVLVLDLWDTTQMPSLQAGGDVRKTLALFKDYPIESLVTLSTSWPEDRPDRGMSTSVACIDPFWQAVIHAELSLIGVKTFYGDYAATNPVKDLLDNYDPSVMSPPIPFAGYYNACTWYQERQGAGGENEKYRDIAKAFQALPNYHQDNFCWGTKEIAAISSSARAMPGNMAYWNKIRINHHVCAMLQDIEDGLLENILKPKQVDDVPDLE